jgi:uncharacterized protein YecT (DUF1311 family)
LNRRAATRDEPTAGHAIKGGLMRFVRALPLLVLAVGMFAIADAAAAPSFDCSKATGLVEKQICGSSEFEPLDRDIAALYARSLALLSKDGGAALRAEQRTFVKERDECADLIRGDPPVVTDVLQCMRDTMSARKARLQAIIARGQYFK